MGMFVLVVLGIMVMFQIAIAIWVVLKNNESDERYEKELDRIYGRKR